TVIWRSPMASNSTTARNERPIRRWISSVRPPWRPLDASRRVRSSVARGSMPYSAVTQPRAWPLSQGGRRSSNVAVTSTWVSPNFTKHEPSANLTTARSSVMLRNSSGCRRLGRMKPPGGGKCPRQRNMRQSGPAFTGASRRPQERRPVVNLAMGGANGQFCPREGTAPHIARRADRLRRDQSCAAQRTLARDLPADRRILSRDRRAGRLAQHLAPHSDDVVARLGAQRDVGPGAARPDLRAAHLGRAAPDRTWPALLRRCADGDR